MLLSHSKLIERETISKPTSLCLNAGAELCQQYLKVSKVKFPASLKDHFSSSPFTKNDAYLT